MNQSEKAFNEQSHLAIFYWLLEDWHGCKHEIKRLSQSNNSIDTNLHKILKFLVTLNGENSLTESKRSFIKKDINNDFIFKKILLINIEKDLLKTHFLLGDSVSTTKIRSFMLQLMETFPSKKIVSLIKFGLLEDLSIVKEDLKIASLDTWVSDFKSKLNILKVEDINKIELLLEKVYLKNKALTKHKKVLADLYMVREDFLNAERLYAEAIDCSIVNESLVIKHVRAKRYAESIGQAVELIKYYIDKLGATPTLLHTLAIYERDRQNFEASLYFVKQTISNHWDYALKINFATFAADILRKNCEYKAAYTHLSEAARVSKVNGQDVSVLVKAMLAELECNVKEDIKDFHEVSSVFYDTIYINSEKYADEASESIYAPVWNNVCKLLTEIDVKRLIDIGCGPGQFAEYLTSHVKGVDYLGLDFSLTAIKLARLRCEDLRFECKDVRDYSDEYGVKDVVYLMLEVLEHIENDIEMFNLLPEGSTVIFSVPNFDSFGHVRFFKSSKQVINYFNNVVKIEYVKAIKLKFDSVIYVVQGKVIKQRGEN